MKTPICTRNLNGRDSATLERFNRELRSLEAGEIRWSAICGFVVSTLSNYSPDSTIHRAISQSGRKYL